MRNFDMKYVITPRGKAILTAIASGLSDDQIAKSLDLNVKTVKMHINVIYSIIGVKDRMQAALWALANHELLGNGDQLTEIDEDLGD